MRRAEWTRRQRLWLGLATMWPAFYVLVFLVLPPTRLFFINHGWRLPPGSLPASYVLAMALHLATVLVTGALMIVYEVHLASTERVIEEQRLPWALLLLLASVVSMPAYWYLFVWREPAVARLRPRRD